MPIEPDGSNTACILENRNDMKRTEEVLATNILPSKWIERIGLRSPCIYNKIFQFLAIIINLLVFGYVYYES